MTTADGAPAPAFRVVATSGTCAVSSLCVYRAGGVFDQDEDGHVLVLDEHPGPAVWEDVRRAARSCPTASIRVFEHGVQTAPAPEPGTHGVHRAHTGPEQEESWRSPR